MLEHFPPFYSFQLKPRANGRSNSQNCWANSVWCRRIRLFTSANTDATTPNIVSPTILGVVASVCTQLKVCPVSNFAEQHATTCNGVCKQTHHVTSNNVAAVCTGLQTGQTVVKLIRRLSIVVFLPIFYKDADSKAEIARKNQVMVAHPRQASLPLCSLIVTLYYCCRYHFGEPEVKGIFVSTVLGITMA